VREVLQWLQKIVQQWTPRQDSSGSGAIQVGKMGGGITNVHLTQNIYHGTPPGTRRPKPVVSPECKQVLALLDQVPDRIAVLDFMEREFNTRMVIELERPQLFRVRRYVEAVLRKK
jgi:hypothetical protein